MGLWAGPMRQGDAGGVGLVDAGRVPTRPVLAGREDRDVSVGGSAGEAEAELVRSPVDGVHPRRAVVVEDVGLSPLVPVLFPDDDLAVEEARCQDGPELWVGPRDLPDPNAVPRQRRQVPRGVVSDADDLDCGVVLRLSGEDSRRQVVLRRHHLYPHFSV